VACTKGGLISQVSLYFRVYFQHTPKQSHTVAGSKVTKTELKKKKEINNAVVRAGEVTVIKLQQ
jgi:hypothetical protein